jgi:hypothetical protein
MQSCILGKPFNIVLAIAFWLQTPYPVWKHLRSIERERVCVCVLWGVVIVGKSIVHSRGEVERETNHPDQTLDIDAETMLA